MGEFSKTLQNLTPAVLEGYLKQGYSQSDVSRMYGTSRQYISEIAIKYGLVDETPRKRALREFPFTVPASQQKTSVCLRLRDHGEYYYTHGKGMPENRIMRLRGLYRRLEDKVVEFDPELPPVPGFSNNGGWALRDRTPEDGDLMVRVNEHTRITEEGSKIWRLPKEKP